MNIIYILDIRIKFFLLLKYSIDYIVLLFDINLFFSI